MILPDVALGDSASCSRGWGRTRFFVFGLDKFGIFVYNNIKVQKGRLTMTSTERLISTMESETKPVLDKVTAILKILYAMEEYDAYKAMYYGEDTKEKRTLRALADSLHEIVDETFDYVDDLIDRIPKWEKWA